MDSDIPFTRKLVYRAYRVTYDWVPQLPKPKESTVDAGPNYLFTIPTDDGSRPDFGIEKTESGSREGVREESNEAVKRRLMEVITDV